MRGQMIVRCEEFGYHVQGPGPQKPRKLTSCLGEILEFVGSRSPSEPAVNIYRNKIR